MVDQPRTPRRRRRAIVASIVIVVVAVFGWTAYETWSARSAMSAAWDDLTYIEHHQHALDTAAGRTQLRARLAAADQQIQRAHSDLNDSVLLPAVGVLPWVHTQWQGTTTLLSDASTADVTAQSLLSQLDSFARTKHHGRISLPALADFERAARSDLATLSSLDRGASGLAGPIGGYRVRFDDKITKVTHALAQGISGMQLASSLLGSGGPINVLIVSENNAEMRDQGAVLSYALLRGDNGNLTVLQKGPVADIPVPAPVNVAMSPGQRAVFAINLPNQVWQSVDSTANFSWSGKAAAAMFESATGIHVNAVIGLDVVAMSNLLAATGPIRVPELAEPITATNLAPIVLHQLYLDFPSGSQVLRHDLLSKIAGAIFNAIRNRHVEPVSAVRAFGEGIGGRHVLLWSENPTIEAAITRLGASGQIGLSMPNHTWHVAVESAVAAKLDYFVDVHTDYKVTLLDDGAAWVQTRITEINHAPSGLPPSYALGPDGINSSIEGQYVSNNFIWTPQGSIRPGSVEESGLKLSEYTLVVNAGQEKSFDVWTYLPHAVTDGHFTMRLVPQGRLRPQLATIEVFGHNVAPLGPSTWSKALTTDQIVTFAVSSH